MSLADDVKRGIIELLAAILVLGIVLGVVLVLVWEKI